MAGEVMGGEVAGLNPGAPTFVKTCESAAWRGEAVGIGERLGWPVEESTGVEKEEEGNGDEGDADEVRGAKIILREGRERGRGEAFVEEEARDGDGEGGEVDEIRFFGEDESRDPESGAPEVAGLGGVVEAREAESCEEEEKKEEGFVDGVATVKDHGGGDGDGEGGDLARVRIEEASIGEGEGDAGGAEESGGEAEDPEIVAEEGLGEKEEIEVKGAVKVGGVVVIEASLGEGIDERSVDAFIKVSGFIAEPEDAEEKGEEEDGGRKPSGEMEGGFDHEGRGLIEWRLARCRITHTFRLFCPLTMRRKGCQQHWND